ESLAPKRTEKTICQTKSLGSPALSEALCQRFWSDREFGRPEDKQVIAGSIGDAAVDMKHDTPLTDDSFVINLTAWSLRSKRNL
ncbi:MAG: hypothetical protein ACREFF_14720, partial [Candidatus Udaeobacter sp.]